MTDIRPLRNEEDYDKALADIARAFDDQPAQGSAAGDRFELLAAIIEAYEDRHYPIQASRHMMGIEPWLAWRD